MRNVDTLGFFTHDGSRYSAHVLLPANGNRDDFFQNKKGEVLDQVGGPVPNTTNGTAAAIITIQEDQVISVAGKMRQANYDIWALH